MKFNIELYTDNSAFENGDEEVDYVLAQIRKKILQAKSGKILDSNGNSTGSVKAS